MAAVRPEFRVDLYVPDPDHPVLGRGACSVSGCDRSPTGNRLCSAHQRRWVDRGRPGLPEFLLDPGPVLNGRRNLTGCTVPGCRYGSSGLGLCMRHRSAWTTSRHPDPVAWAAAQALAPDHTQAEAGVAASAGVSFVDPTPWVCPSDPCPVVIGRFLVYRDEHHLATPFATALARRLLAALPPALAAARADPDRPRSGDPAGSG